MKFLFAFICLLFHFPAFADLERWQKWEVERNDLQLNPAIYHKLPSRGELQSYQTETLYVLEIDPGKVGIIAATSLDPELAARLRTPEGKVKFFIHPKALELFKELIPQGVLKTVKARATTSPRTFFVGDVMVKVSLPQKINGAIRTVYPLQMSRATAINDLMRNIPGFNYLPEPLAVFDKTPDSPFGFIVREIPAEFIHGEKTLVPLLSYVANSQGESLLERDAALRKVGVQELVTEKLIPALVRSFRAAASHGIAIEAHQQNTLLEVDREGRFTGQIYYRDLDGARVDFQLRRELGFHDEKLLTMKDAVWIFDLENLEKMRLQNKVPAARPKEWSPVIEAAFKTYLVGSSLDLIKSKLQRLRIQASFEAIIEREMKKDGAGPLCRGLFL